MNENENILNEWKWNYFQWMKMKLFSMNENETILNEWKWNYYTRQYIVGEGQQSRT